jgi:hypothetical protein
MVCCVAPGYGPTRPEGPRHFPWPCVATQPPPPPLDRPNNSPRGVSLSRVALHDRAVGERDSSAARKGLACHLVRSSVIDPVLPSVPGLASEDDERSRPEHDRYHFAGPKAGEVHDAGGEEREGDHAGPEAVRPVDVRIDALAGRVLCETQSASSSLSSQVSKRAREQC